MMLIRKTCEFVGDLYGVLDRRRVIQNEDYMIRHYLLFKGQEFDNKDDKEKRRVYPFNAFLHEIKGSDERTFHDHPWAYTTVILTGGYWEHTPVFDWKGEIVGEERKWYGPGSVLRREPNHYHFLEMGDNGSTWTLFMRGKRVQEWGFLPFGGGEKIHWEEYLKNV
jgi:hypothetical protein